MTHCATCTCGVGEDVPQPSSSSPGIRRLALQTVAEAVRAAKVREGR